MPKQAPAPSERDPYRDRWDKLSDNVLRGLRHIGSGNKRAVLFIHGLTGDYDATWVGDPARLSFPELVFTDDTLGDYDVFSFAYRSKRISGTTVQDAANQLNTEIKQRLKGYEQVVVIAHSLGGLVAMQYIIDNVKLGNTIPVVGLMLYGVPTSGSHLAQIARLGGATLAFGLGAAGAYVLGAAGVLAGKALGWAASFVLRGHPQIKQLELGGEFVQSINDEWAFRVANGGHHSEDASRRENLQVRVVFGTLDKVVPKFSAKSVYGAVDSDPIDYDHIGLVKPLGRTDPRYQRAHAFLQDCRRATDREAAKSLRQVSDSVMESSESLLCRDWHYNIELKGASDAPDPGGLLQNGFSRFRVQKCEYRRTITDKENVVGFTWGTPAAMDAWEVKPLYVHEILNKEMNQNEKSSIANAINGVLVKEPEVSWNILFPDLSVGATIRGIKVALIPVPGSISKEPSAMFRRYALPDNVVLRPGEEAVVSISFTSFIPTSTEIFTLFFPWFHHKFKGHITIHEKCKSLRDSQFVAGGPEIVVEENQVLNEYAYMRLKTEGIVLPNSRVEVSWSK